MMSVAGQEGKPFGEGRICTCRFPKTALSGMGGPEYTVNSAMAELAFLIPGMTFAMLALRTAASFDRRSTRTFTNNCIQEMDENENSSRRELLVGAATVITGLAVAAVRVKAQDTDTTSTDTTTTPTTPPNPPAENSDPPKGAVTGSVEKKLGSPPSAEPDLPSKDFKLTAFTTDKSLESEMARDEVTWKSIVANYDKSYGVNSDGKVKPTSSDQYLTIDYGFVYSPEDDDGDLRFHHVEQLLDQSADLLDRCQRERDDWDIKGERALSTALELREYFELDEIHKRETKAGFYTIPAKEAESIFQAESALGFGYSLAAQRLSNLLFNQFQFAQLVSRGQRMQQSAWASALPGYPTPVSGPALKHVFNGKPNETWNHLAEAANELGWNTIVTQDAVLRSEADISTFTSQASSIRQLGMKARMEWEQKDALFRRERTEVARRLADTKANAATKPGGILNYPERMTSIRERFRRDLRDAYSRMQVAAKGLKLIYAYSAPLPQLAKQGTPGFFDDCLYWVRDAIAYVVRFSLLEQNYVLPISLKEIMGNALDRESNFKKALKKAKDTNSTKFTFPLPIGTAPFLDRRHVRIRGLSAYIECGAKHIGVWQITLTPPLNTASKHLNGTMVTFDQDVPPCPLGRVASRDYIRDPDVVGREALFNVSPIGNWNIELERRSTSGVVAEEIDDIIIDFYIAVRFIKS